ncbi:sigma54 specific transcriptional regulator, Fis family [Alkaliphilus metalliredigens QYMF]|uniref:Sigma54 specific transcriptional regulator, Fis family n=1 Tax=Alkaliphilus metalliredigens (strain QYMF) TaxID=293826 RepID=A6TPV3_ALKMQ|nr:sigma 54-interacting transcriptional regulator [Alkaliphilus metalliredigens]ABR48221.1 sigma54 specific transcriptional regulator, Fis family [Alkaliphilus metalliredigens QYMF]
MIFQESDVRLFTDMMMEGFIYIDHHGVIRLYNQKAKKIFGIIYKQDHEHSNGRIEPGDLVIIADNCLGEDDGNLDTTSLTSIGIPPKAVQSGDAVVAVGIFESKINKGEFKILKNTGYSENLVLNTEFQQRSINVEIKFNEKLIRIEVGNQQFDMPYMKAVGHMVVLEGQSGAVKFYQERGYSVRKESIGQLLKGKTFRAKGNQEEHLNALGKHLLDIHDETPVIREFIQAAKGSGIGYQNRFAEINGRQTLCSLIPVNKGRKGRGAVLKVEDVTEIKQVIHERSEALHNLELAQNRLMGEDAAKEAFPEIIGDSEEMRHIRMMAAKAAKTSSNVLLLGESGTGKTILAKAIHRAGEKESMAFVQINCGSIPENLLESEMFGYEKGAFTGANKEGKKGLFEVADGGTLFLDEIGELPSALQVKLLHVIQHRSFYRVGGNEKINVNVRIIAATNRNLEEEMRQGRFREDLYYRINVLPIWIPPLRQRKDDIQLLVKKLLHRTCQQAGVEEKLLSAEALLKLRKYHWPGNIRELENTLERAMHLSDSRILLSGQMMVKVTDSFVQYQYEEAPLPTIKEAVRKCEKELINETLKHFKGNRKKAMQQLGIAKTRFYEKIKEYKIIEDGRRD